MVINQRWWEPDIVLVRFGPKGVVEHSEYVFTIAYGYAGHPIKKTSNKPILREAREEIIEWCEKKGIELPRSWDDE